MHAHPHTHRYKTFICALASARTCIHTHAHPVGRVPLGGKGARQAVVSKVEDCQPWKGWRPPPLCNAHACLSLDGCSVLAGSLDSMIPCGHCHEKPDQFPQPQKSPKNAFPLGLLADQTWICKHTLERKKGHSTTPVSHTIALQCWAFQGAVKRSPWLRAVGVVGAHRGTAWPHNRLTAPQAARLHGLMDHPQAAQANYGFTTPTTNPQDCCCPPLDLSEGSHMAVTVTGTVADLIVILKYL